MSAPPLREPERLRFPGVHAPKPLLSGEAEQRLTARQRELLDALERVVTKKGLGDLTMADLAAKVNCSLRTLYEIAPSKEELVLTVVDRRLHRIGRDAIESLDASLPPLEALRAYLGAANEAVQPETTLFSRELSALPGAGRVLDGHERYVMAVTQSLLDRAVAAGDVHAIDTAAIAHVLGGLGREFSRPELRDVTAGSPKATADAITQIILRGLTRTGDL